MSTEGHSEESLVHLPYHREAIGQIRFDPSEEMAHCLAGLYQPDRRESAKKGMYLSSQYRLVADQAPDGVIQGEAGRKAERLKRALGRSVTTKKRLSSYMRHAEANINGRDMFALQFAVHLDRVTINAIDGDEILSTEPILENRATTLKAIKVYDTNDMISGRDRERALRSLSTFVTGMEILSKGGGDERRMSPNDDAYVDNVRLTFTQVRRP